MPEPVRVSSPREPTRFPEFESPGADSTCRVSGGSAAGAPVLSVLEQLEPPLSDAARSLVEQFRPRHMSLVPASDAATSAAASVRSAGARTAELAMIARPSGTEPHGPLAAPENLVHVGGGAYVNKPAAEAFQRLRQYAQRDGIDVTQRFVPYSGFRSDKQQAELNRNDPASHAAGLRATAGNSPHRTGNALDITVGPGGAQRNSEGAARGALEQDPAAQWLIKNAPRFGFNVLGYSEQGAKLHRKYEPWHITFNPKPHAELPPALAQQEVM